MAARFDLVTIDAPDPDELARFWCSALALRETEREDGGRWIVLADHEGSRRIGLQRGPHRPGGAHLDLSCAPAEIDSEVARLTTIGARLLQPLRSEPYGSIANLCDPDGNLFDLCSYF